MGYGSSNDISGIYFVNRSFTVPGAIGYMESHDEERLMYKNLQFGNSAGLYSVKTLSTALNRIKAANLIFYSIPGPKMIWQFGELGYDLSINTCSDGTTNNNCRTSAKPIKWEYQQVGDRASLFTVTADLIRLRNTYSVFTSGDATLIGGSNLVKQVMLKNKPYTASPTNSSQMNVVSVANFDVSNQTVQITFPHTGTWYDYYEYGAQLNVTSTNQSMELTPGQYKLYTDVLIQNLITSTEEEHVSISLFPNPTNDVLRVQAEKPIQSLALISMQGSAVLPKRIDTESWDVSSMSAGLYIAEIRFENSVIRKRVLKK
ncbi:MAG: T9SS type A sorting domain-containing protein [Cyclobacteriaceae bacterium]|nr:T9SS type A sorting domain-containing protein [Cyclobacteriaceae bacterium]